MVICRQQAASRLINPRRDMMQKAGTEDVGFQLECWRPDLLTSEDRLLLKEKVFGISGQHNVGKSTVLGLLIRLSGGKICQLPESKTRAQRPDDRPGISVDLISEETYERLCQDGRMLLGYRANIGEREHHVGLRLDLLREKLRDRKCHKIGIIIHPLAMKLLREIYPALPHFVVRTEKEDHERFSELKGETLEVIKGQNIAGFYRRYRISRDVVVSNPLGFSHVAAVDIADKLNILPILDQRRIDAAADHK